MTAMRTIIIIGQAVACSIILLLTAPVRAGAEQALKFDIATQPLVPALKAFAEQANMQLLYKHEVVESATANAVVGSFEKREALAQLVRGTGLEIVFTDDDSAIIRLKGDAAANTEAADAGLRLAQSEDAQSAQDQKSGASSSGASSEAAEDKSVKLEEIVVTAQKRNERIQDVPMSITAIGAEDIDRRGLRDAEDYLRGMPGTTQSGYSQGQTIIIRGLESTTRDQNFGSGPVVATYFGETPTTNTGGIQGGSNVDLKLIDIERIEVLRGPQGTTFGNSSLGGAVRVIPAAPNFDKVEGRIGVGYSSTDGGGDNYEVDGVLNLPLSERIAFRGVLYQTNDSGYYRNVAGSDPAFQSAVVVPLGAEAIAVDDEDVGERTVTGVRTAFLFQLNDATRFTASYVNQKSETNGFGISTLRDYTQALLQVAPEHTYRGQTEGVLDTRVEIANATLGYNLGWGNLLATYSYSDTSMLQAAPFDAIGPGLSGVSYDSKGPHREHVGEVRLSTSFDGQLNGLLGVYYEEQRDTINTSYLWAADPTRNFRDPTGFFDPARRRLGDRYDERNLTQTAAFGELTWNFAPDFYLTGGARLYDYDRDYIIEAVGAFYGLAGTHERGETNVSDTNFKANLGYKPNDNVHLYAGWAQGFRLGRPQGGLPAGACDLNNDGLNDDDGIALADTRIVDPDNVDSYEVGGKFALFDRRLRVDAALFLVDWSGVPLRIRGDQNGINLLCRFTYNDNVGDAQSEGAEFQATWQLTHGLRLDFGGSYIHAEIAESVTRLAVVGQRLPGSPEWNTNLGLQYEFPVSNMEAFLRLDSIYVGSFYDNLAQSPLGRSGDYIQLDASARLMTGSFNVDAYVHNLTDEEAFTGHQALAAFYGYQLRPREVGLRLGFNF